MAPFAYHLGGLPPPELDWQQLIPLLGPASANAGLLEGRLCLLLWITKTDP